MRYRILEFYDQEEREWQPVGIVAEAGAGLLARFDHGRPAPGLRKAIEDVGKQDFPGSWEPGDLRLSEPLTAPGQPLGRDLLDRMLELVQRRVPEGSFPR